MDFKIIPPDTLYKVVGVLFGLFVASIFVGYLIGYFSR